MDNYKHLRLKNVQQFAYLEQQKAKIVRVQVIFEGNTSILLYTL